MRSHGPWSVLALAMVQACGGGGGGDVVEPPAAVASVTVTLAASQVYIGQTSQGTAVVRDAQNNVLTGRTVTWSSSNTAVATVASSSGLVTGVTAGSATISATSEGKTGQADITVTVDPATQPQIQNVTVTQNGQPANLSQVVGTLSLAYRVQVPSGYSGTLTVKVDSVEYLRETITAPPLAARVLPGTTATPIVVTVDRTTAVNTANTVMTVGADKVSELPLHSNRDLAAIVQLVPNSAGGPSAQQSVNFRTANPPYARGWLRIDGTPATGSDGLTYGGSPIDAAVSITTFDNEVINGFEVAVGPASAEYGRATGGVVDVITRVPRTNFNFFQINNLNVEQSNLTMILTRITRNGQDINPQVDYFGNSAYTTDLIGSGFANTAQQVVGRTPPAGKQYFQVAHSQFSPWSTGAIRVRAAIDPFHLDNLGPRLSSPASQPVFSFLDRQTTVGGSAFWPTYGYGAASNQLSARYDFSGGFRADRLTDISGLDLPNVRYYAGPVSDLANLYTPQYLVGSTFQLNESSGSRLYTAGVRVPDKRGNLSDWSLSTTLGNPWNTSGQQSTGAQIGVQQGAFGFTALRASLNTTGMPDDAVWNSTALDASIGWDWNVTGSLVGLPNGWLSGRAKLNGIWYLGTGAAKDGYQVLPSTGGATGGAASVTAKFLTDANSTQVPTQQGLYEIDFKAADNAARYIGDMMYPRVRRLLVDYAPSTNAGISYDAPVTPGAQSSGTISGFDPYGINAAYVGFRFNYPSALFVGGKAYVPAGEIGVPGTFGGSVTTNLSMQLSGIPPVGFWFFNPFSGVVDWGNLHRSDATVLQLRDWAWNLSAPYFAPYTNTAPIPSLTNVSDVRASIGTSNWCPGTCTLGGSRLVDLNFDYFDDRPTGDPMISKAQWYGIPLGGGGIVYPLGVQTSYNTATEGLGRRISFDLTLDLGRYCGPAGSMAVFPIGYARDYKSFVKAGTFFSATVRTPTRFSNDCNKPPPTPPPPPPP